MTLVDDRSELAAERDFFRRLLELGGAEETEPLLDQALKLIVEATGAQAAYLQLDDPSRKSTSMWKAYGSAADVATIRASISQGIVARALSEGRTVSTPSAVDDPAFRDQSSVLRHRIRAVLCAPVGTPALGVVYLQAGEASDQFTVANRHHVELFARLLAPFADRLLARQINAGTVDHTREIRERFRCEGVIGRSRALAAVLNEAWNAARSNAGVLITGPVGTGKSAIARAIAVNSPRATKPFYALNCANFERQFLVSELFGHVKGAFTGADIAKPGLVTVAKGGVLFLDEVGELPMEAQGKLLQLLEERIYMPLGATATLTADVRILAATNSDLKAMIKRKQFREDLYSRLHVLPIVMPGLEQRREDIPDLVDAFCAEACRAENRRPMRVSRRALLACTEATWVNNVRELENAVLAGVVRVPEHGDVLDVHHIFPLEPPADREIPSYREATQRFQRRYLREALDRHGWNITQAAGELDLARQYLHDLIKAFDLQRPTPDDNRSH